jgi:redox-sensitive bicupin YhaK (pirin superfamily)
MITIRRADERGHADHGWLDAHHTFSFAAYHDPAWERFGDLRVLNHDVVQPGTGFGTHPHRDMEILTYVLRGELRHEDSMGNGSVIRPGDVQFMSAGSGVTHSEVNPSGSEPVELLQMWVVPSQRSTAPRYEQRHYPEAERRGRLLLVASPDGRDGSITVGQDVRLYAGLFHRGETASLTLEGSRAWLQVASGELKLDGRLLQAGDGAGITDQQSLALEGVDAANVVVFDLR